MYSTAKNLIPTAPQLGRRPKSKPVFSATQPVAKRQRGAPQPTRQCPPFANPPTFVGYQLGAKRMGYTELQQPRKVEADFFESLTYLADTYGFSIQEQDYSIHPFPRNIATAYRDAVNKLKQIEPSLSLIIGKTPTDQITVIAYAFLDLGFQPYYIPLAPFVELKADRRQRATVNLLESVFAYLVQVVELPHLGHHWGYIPSQMDYYVEHREGLEEELQPTVFDGLTPNWPQVRPTKKSRVFLEPPSTWQCQIDYIYNQAERLIKGTKRKQALEAFGHRLENYRAKTPHQQKIYSLAKDFYALYQQYPTRSHWDSIHGFLYDYDAYVLELDAYVGFIWQTRGELYDFMTENLNSDCQEVAGVVEPSFIQLFNQPAQEKKPLFEFELKLFPLLNRLSTWAS